MHVRNEMKQALILLAAVAAISVGSGWVQAQSDNAPAVTIPPGNAAPTTQPAASPTTAPTTGPASMPTGGTPSSGTAGSSSGTAGSSSGTAGSSASGSGSSAPTGGKHSHSHLKPSKHRRAHRRGSSGNSASLSSFIGEVSATNVNVRSGPGLRYYIVGQLNKGALVNVVKTTNGWDVISAPAGARCYVAKQYVKLNSTGDRGTITSRFVNLRAASALTPTSDYAVVGLARRGQRVSVVGQSGMFYIIRAPMHTHFYIYASFVKPAPAGSTYISPQLQMPPNFAGVTVAGLAPSSVQNVGGSASVPAGNGAASSVANAPAVAAPVSGAPSSAVAPASNGSTPAAVTPAPVVPAGIKPAPTYNPKAYRQFSKLDKALLVQFQKPLLDRKLGKLQQGFTALLQEKHLPGSIRSATKLRLKEIKRMMAIQKLAAAPVASTPITATIAPYQQQWEQSKKILEKSIATAPFLARGLLETSHTTHQYALLNPYNGRVVAYIQPPKDMDLSKLIGSYVGIKGLVVSKTGAFIRVIKPNSATLLPNPKP
ncbi:MAG: SH3 domain-containing protein [Phycisphaerae bacterium]